MPSETTLHSKRRWDIREGKAQEVAPALGKERSEVLAFVSHGADVETVRQQFEVLKQIADLLQEKIDARRSQKWKALVEALTPDVQLSPTKIIEAKMMGEARTAILEGGDFVTASDIAKAAHFSVKNPSSQPNRWKRKRQIFAITNKGTDLYPVYALDKESGLRPLSVVAEILRIFENKKNGWETAFWFASLNSYLKNRKPKNLLISDPENVLRAAKIEAAGVKHG